VVSLPHKDPPQHTGNKDTDTVKSRHWVSQTSHWKTPLPKFGSKYTVYHTVPTRDCILQTHWIFITAGLQEPRRNQPRWSETHAVERGSRLGCTRVPAWHMPFQQQVISQP